MPAPVFPNDFKAVISDPTQILCGNFVNTLLKMPVLLWKLVTWMFDAAGNPTPDFLRSVRATGDLIFSAGPLAENANRLLCDGRDLSRTDYAALFLVIGTVYGSGSGSTFKLPDFRARFPVGVGTFPGGATSVLGVPGGEDKHIITMGELPKHKHLNSMRVTSDPGSGADKTWTDNAGSQPIGGSDFCTGPTSGAHTPLMQPYTDEQGAASPTAITNLPPYLPAYIYIAT